MPNHFVNMPIQRLIKLTIYDIKKRRLPYKPKRFVDNTASSKSIGVTGVEPIVNNAINGYYTAFLYFRAKFRA